MNLLTTRFVHARFVSQSRKQWKSEISAVVACEDHDCNVLSMFTNSKLFQRLLCLGVGQSELALGGSAPLGDDSAHLAPPTNWLSALNGSSKSTNSSDTEAMEYEDIDRYLVTVDSAAVAKDMMESCSARNSTSKLKRSRFGVSYNESASMPSPGYKDHDPDFTVGRKLSLKIRQKYTKRKKNAKQNGPLRMKDALGNVTKMQKTRVVKIIDPGTNCIYSYSLISTNFDKTQLYNRAKLK